jgi:hypothetical protein
VKSLDIKLELVNQGKVLFVDPGRLSEEVSLWLEQFQNYKKIMDLIYEHFDHHYDVNKVSVFKNTFVYLSSDAFKNALFNNRTNLSC